MSASAYAARSRSRSRNSRASSALACGSILISGSVGAAVIGPPSKGPSGPPPVAEWTPSVPGRPASVRDERDDVEAAQLLASFERAQLDEECEGDDLPFELLHELYRPGNGAPGRQEVVHNEDARARFEGVLVHLEGRRSVLEVVFDANHVGGQLAKLADRDEAHAELVRDRRGEDESA